MVALGNILSVLSGFSWHQPMIPVIPSSGFCKSDLGQVGSSISFASSRFDFQHGIASGDPTFQDVVLWTRITPVKEDESGMVPVEVAVCKNKDDLPMAWWNSWWFNMKKVDCKRYITMTSENVDYNVKVIAHGLKENTSYYYQFRASHGRKSNIGYTKTLPMPKTHIENLTYALFSCSHFTFGYFHAYELAAKAENLDFWVHVGDWMYEYGDNDSFNGDARGIGLMGNETLTLEDYRNRHKIYRTDPGLQMLQSRAPMFAMWDDHEVSDDSRSDGANNHNEGEGEYRSRLYNGLRAYHEWLPVRSRGCLDDVNTLTNITFERHIGDLMTLAGYETRFRHRTLADNTDFLTSEHAILGLVLKYPNVSDWFTPEVRPLFEQAAETVRNDLNVSAELIGDKYVQSMKRLFQKSKEYDIPWQMLATSVPMSERFLGDLLGTMQTIRGDLEPYVQLGVIPSAQADLIAGGFQQIITVAFQQPLIRLSQASASFKIPFNSDAWDGFKFERERILQIFKDYTNNAIVMAGDSHNAHLTLLKTEDGTPVAVEFDTASVSSPGIEREVEGVTNILKGPGFDAIESSILKGNPDTYRYTNIKDRGFILFRVTPQSLRAEYVMINPDRNSPINSNAGSLKNATFDGQYYCDAKAQTNAGSRGTVQVDHQQYFVPVSCDSQFSQEYYDRIFARKRPSHMFRGKQQKPGYY